MVRYMVALDSDEGKSKLLLDGALRLAVPGKDILMLARVIPEMELDTATIILSPKYPAVLEEQIQCEIGERKKMAELDKACLAAKVESSFVVITNDHPGYSLCKAAKDYKIDCMIVGRRSLGAIKRLITSSTSKYLIDHADCNVLVIKKPYSSEQSVRQGLTAEEKEKRQISSEDPSAQPVFTIKSSAEFQAWRDLQMGTAFSQPSQEGFRDEKRDITEAAERKIESAKDLELAHQLEEQARIEQIKEWQDDKAREREERNLERMVSLERLRISEEEERAYRIRKQKEEDTQERVLAHVHSQQDREIARKMEEEERQRRILEETDIDRRRLQESRDDLAFVVGLKPLQTVHK